MAGYGNRSDYLEALKVDELKRRIEELKQQLENVNREIGTRPASEENAERMHPGAPTGKSGYLFKWQDRSIGWGGTKWGLRFVSLDRGRIAYYRTHEERAPRYILPLRRIAVRDDGCKRNMKHASKSEVPNTNEVGAYYHVFSIYQRPESDNNHGAAEDDDDAEIIPLLRFSTPSLAEKLQWIELIGEECAFADEYSAEKRGAQEKNLNQPGVKLPATKPGTLAPLIFGVPPLPKPRRVPSGAKSLNRMMKRSRSHTKVSSAVDSARSNRCDVSAYPPSKPMHRESAPSFLSAEASNQNYRGLLNLALILLVVSNFRLILDTVRTHGFALAQLKSVDADVVISFADAPLTVSPFLSGMAILQVTTVVSFLVERLLSLKYVKEWIGMALHLGNANAALLVPGWIVWSMIDRPVIGAILLLHGVIWWMKLISYAHANSYYRSAPESHEATIALLRDLDEGAHISYPSNVSLKNSYYFFLAPTLTYQIAFPRNRAVRFTKVAGIALRLVVAIAFLLFLIAQVISPNLDLLVKDLETSGDRVFSANILGDYLLKLSIANTYAWLLVFYIYFHLYLNLFAELLRFGDRVFYKDWWNATNVSSYWRLWNQPVHYWLVRHVYFPCYRCGLSKTAATFVVFLVSAILHEVLVSVPFHMVRFHSFLGMLGQLPLVAVTKKIEKIWPGSSIGNVIFWIIFCVVGQPMAVLLYTIDYWNASNGTCSSGL